MKRGSWILKMVAFGALMIAVFGLVTQLLWNWLVPVLFAGPVITFWQALGLLILTKILFWGFGKKHHGGPHQGWRPYWKEKWNTMSDEEKERFRQKMKEKCSWGRPVRQEEKAADAE